MHLPRRRRSATFSIRLGMLSEDGFTRVATEYKKPCGTRRDSLTDLIGAGPLVSVAIDAVDTVEQAMEAR